MTKAETERHLFNVYRDWLQENRDTREKELMFWGYINHLTEFSQFGFGRNSGYQMTAIWVREWNERLGIDS
ncbi:hypothetical protein ACEF96_003239 [Salmonella enterica]|nr:hypothetical protein [Salmonella enterica]